MRQRAASFERFRQDLEVELGVDLPVGRPRPPAPAPGDDAWPVIEAAGEHLVPMRVLSRAEVAHPYVWDWNALDPLLARNEPFSAAVAPVLSCTRCRVPLGRDGKPTDVRVLEHATGILTVRATRLALLGRGDEAAASLALVVRLAHACEEDEGLDALEVESGLATVLKQLDDNLHRYNALTKTGLEGYLKQYDDSLSTATTKLSSTVKDLDEVLESFGDHMDLIRTAVGKGGVG